MLLGTFNSLLKRTQTHNRSSKEGGGIEDFVKAFPPLKTDPSESHISDSELGGAAPSIPSLPDLSRFTALQRCPGPTPSTSKKISGHYFRVTQALKASPQYSHLLQREALQSFRLSLSMLSVQELEDPGAPVFPSPGNSAMLQ